MISDCMQKINQCIISDIQNTLQSPQHSSSLLFQLQLKKSTEYLQTLKKNSHKIEQLIIQNDKLRHEITLQRKTIEMHLKKEIQLKYVISALEEQVQILNEKLIILEALKVQKSTPKEPLQISQKQIYKLQQKLSNCITQNQILRSENESYRAKEFTKEQNYRTIEQQFKQNLKSMSEQINLLKTDLQFQTQKASLLEKIQAQNHLLKIQNKKLQSMMELKLQEYEAKMTVLVKELESEKFGKEVLREKYEELTGVIQIVDQMRHQFKTKKKSLEFANQQNGLLNPVQFNQSYHLLTKTKKTLKKSTMAKETKQNKP